MIDIFIGGEIYKLNEEAKEKFRQFYKTIWREDILNWSLALLLRDGLINREDGRERALKAITNTMQIIGITWREVEELISHITWREIQELISEK